MQANVFFSKTADLDFGGKKLVLPLILSFFEKHFSFKYLVITLKPNLTKSVKCQ